MLQQKIVLIPALAIVLTACNPSGNENTPASAAEPPATTATSSEVVATVNGVQITLDDLAVYTNQRNSRLKTGAESDPKVVLDELVGLELMRQEAVRKGLDKKPDIVNEIDQQRRTLLAGAALRDYLQNNQISDEDLRLMYDQQAAQPGMEYKARHILLPTEAEARNAITRLDEGGDFAEMAKELSTGPTGKNGGDLGWFASGQMVKPFSEATAALDKGTYTKDPVQTQFGWHVILLEDSRESTPPAFEDVKDRLRTAATSQRLKQHMQEIRDSAEVTMPESSQ
mgnify:CR=1 FL=1